MCKPSFTVENCPAPSKGIELICIVATFFAIRFKLSNFDAFNIMNFTGDTL
jgi:hypothetical protein